MPNVYEKRIHKGCFFYWNIFSNFYASIWFVDCKTVVFFFLKISKEIGKAWRKSFKCSKRASGRVRQGKKKLGLSPVSLSVFTLVSDLLFDCSKVLEYAKIRNVLQSIWFETEFV